MQIAIALYDRFTVLDAVGPYQILAGCPGAETVFVAEQAGPVRDDNGTLALVADKSFAEVQQPRHRGRARRPGPERPDGERRCSWTGSAPSTPPVHLDHLRVHRLPAPRRGRPPRRAPRHLALARPCDQLNRFGVEPTGERVVFDGKYVTAAGVSAGIDMGLTLAGRIAGDEHAQTVQLLTEYDPQPPYDAGSPEKAPAHLVEAFRDGSRFSPGAAR